MVLVKTSIAVSQLSGSIGGTTFARNRGGQYARSRISPLNPATSRQSQVRATLASLSNRWTTVLTQSQRDAWDLYASNVPLTNNLGEQIFVSGINMYVRANSVLLDTDNDVADDGPTTFTQGPSVIPTLAVDEATDMIEITNLGDFDPGDPDIGFLLQMGPPQNAGINFFSSPFRKIYGAEVTDAVPTFPVDDIPAAFPFSAGQAIFLRSRAVTLDGRLGPANVQRFLAE